MDYPINPLELNVAKVAYFENLTDEQLSRCPSISQNEGRNISLPLVGTLFYWTDKSSFFHTFKLFYVIVPSVSKKNVSAEAIALNIRQTVDITSLPQTAVIAIVPIVYALLIVMGLGFLAYSFTKLENVADSPNVSLFLIAVIIIVAIIALKLWKK